MNRPRLGVLAGAALLALAAGLRADQFEDARAEATRNLAAPGGREYDAKLLAAFEERHGKALNECATTVSDVELDPFTAVLELGADGHAKQVLLRPANGAAVCLRWSLRGGTFPKPPRAGFWAIEIDPRSRRASPPAAPSPSPPAAQSAPAPPAQSPSFPAIPTPTPSSLAAAPAGAAPPAASPVEPSPTAPSSPSAPTRAATPQPARPSPPPAPSGGIVDVRFAEVAAGAEGDDALRRRDAAEAAQRQRVERALVTGVGLASLPRLDAWRGASGARFRSTLAVHGSAAPSGSELEDIRQARRDGRIAALEIQAQAEGIAPDDPRLEPWWSLAEQLDLPVAIALGSVPATSRDPRYRVALGDPLRLEPVLLRHPRLRVLVRGGAWPFADSMAAILSAYPQVFVDTGGIAWRLGRAELHAYLERLVDSGFADRILFASGAEDPSQLTRAIEAIESEAALTTDQKRAILHDNAARWLGIERPR